MVWSGGAVVAECVGGVVGSSVVCCGTCVCFYLVVRKFQETPSSFSTAGPDHTKSFRESSKQRTVFEFI